MGLIVVVYLNTASMRKVERVLTYAHSRAAKDFRKVFRFRICGLQSAHFIVVSRSLGQAADAIEALFRVPGEIELSITVYILDPIHDRLPPGPPDRRAFRKCPH